MRRRALPTSQSDAHLVELRVEPSAVAARGAAEVMVAVAVVTHRVRARCSRRRALSADRKLRCRFSRVETVRSTAMTASRPTVRAAVVATGAGAVPVAVAVVVAAAGVIPAVVAAVAGRI
jgi:hypothetical protein